MSPEVDVAAVLAELGIAPEPRPAAAMTAAPVDPRQVEWEEHRAHQAALGKDLPSWHQIRPGAAPPPPRTVGL